MRPRGGCAKVRLLRGSPSTSERWRSFGHMKSRRATQHLFERPEPGLEMAPLIDAFFEDRPAHLLRARGSDAPLGFEEFVALRLKLAPTASHNPTPLPISSLLLICFLSTL